MLSKALILLSFSEFLVPNMTLEEIIQKILSARPEMTRKEIMKMIELKEKSAKGFLTRESAAISLAAELGVPIEGSIRFFRREMSIKDLVSGLSNVTVSGRVIYISPIKKFIRRDGKEGVKISVHIADETGTIKANLWNDKALSLKPENILDKTIRLSHVSVRRAGGKLELNVSDRSKVEIEPEDLKKKDYPPITNFMNKIGEITGDEKSVNIVGFVRKVYPIVVFKRQDGNEGRVRRVEINDQTGETMLILWDDLASIISENHVGKYVAILRAGVKQRFDGRIEIHTKNQTSVFPLARKPSGF